MISLIELFLIIYSLLEQYVMERVAEIKVLRKLEYFSEIERLEVDCMNEQEEVTLLAPSQEHDSMEVVEAEREVSILGAEQEELLQTLTQEFSTESGTSQEYLSIQDADPNKDFGFVSEYHKFATAKIADNQDGPQQWVVKVIGMEGTYIHVTDGTRTWVDIGEEIHKISRNAVLSMNVVRSGRKIEVERIQLLETGINEEYIIPDEAIYLKDVQEAAI